MTGAGHWADVYRTDPHVIYETEAPIFSNLELTRQELQLVTRVAAALETSIASPVLDLACGPGRHTAELGRRGYRVVAVDHSEGLLALAAGAARNRSASRPRFVCGDLRNLPLARGYFETALLLGKSFGYFSDGENRNILRQIGLRLRPGGLFCFELPDRDPYLASLRPFETVERRRENGQTLRSEYHSDWNGESRRLETRESHAVVETGEVLWEGSWDVRLYTAGEIERRVREAGFREATVRAAHLVEAPGAKSDVLIVGAVR